MRQLRDLEQQLNQTTQRQQQSVEDDPHGVGFLQMAPPQERNLSYIRSMEKEKREAFEVGKVDVGKRKNNDLVIPLGHMLVCF